ncbi:MAG TPA: hypothetical protein VGG96_12260, partial [Steroidobacteraceae bacterium]
MKLSRNRILTLAAGGAFVSLALLAVRARADIEPWVQTAVSGSAIETALYRLLDRPGVRVLYPRPPAEARAELDQLVAAYATQSQLYTLRAHVEEQALDFSGAERDWKAFVVHATDKSAAGFELADFYHRRNQGEQEIAALEAAASAPAKPTDAFTPANNQRAWAAFPRALNVAHEQALGDGAVIAVYRAWIARYPAEPSIRGQLVSTLLHLRRFDEAQRGIDDYKAAFPQDNVFPIKAAALLAFDKGTPEATSQAMEMFEKAYQPLWSSDLIGSYFELLDATHTRHTMLMVTRADLVKNPDDLVAATKLFHAYQQQGRTEAAVNMLAQYGASKATRRAAWTPDELYTFAALLDRAAQYPEAARYYYALAASPGGLTATRQSAAEAGLTGLTHILLAAPDQSVAFGAGNLSMYRDLA